MGENTCDGKKEAYEQFGRLKDTYVMDVPHVRNDDTRTQWRNEVKRLAARLEGLTGQKITAASSPTTSAAPSSAWMQRGRRTPFP